MSGDSANEKISRRKNVIVIGAGAAGYACAKRLREYFQNSFSITILEARDRIGGRIKTIDLEGEPIQSLHSGPCLDLGAQWAHNYEDKCYAINLRDFAVNENANLKIALSPPESWSMTKHCLFLWKKNFPEVTEVEVQEMEIWFDDIFSRAVLQWPLICKDLNLVLENSTALDVLNYCLEPNTIEEWFREKRRKGSQNEMQVPSKAAVALCREYQKNLLSSYIGLEAEKTSYESLDENEDSYEHRVVMNGYIKVIQELKEKAGKYVALHLNSVVDAIRQISSDTVRVSWTNQNHEKHYLDCDYCVCTLPLGVLKTNKVQFLPSLPKVIRDSIDSLEMGHSHKVIFLWTANEWPMVSLPGKRIIYLTDYEKTFSYCLNLGEQIWHGKELYGYAAYSSRPFSIIAESLGIEKLTALFMATLKESLQAIGKNVNDLPLPSKAFQSTWLHDPYSLGTYSAQTSGKSLHDFDAFQVEYGNIFFAGEHTQKEMYGCVQAALQSGYRAADKIEKQYHRCD